MWGGLQFDQTKHFFRNLIRNVRRNTILSKKQTNNLIRKGNVFIRNKNNLVRLLMRNLGGLEI